MCSESYDLLAGLIEVGRPRRAARRGQGGPLTTLNFRPGAVTTLNLGHVLIFLSSNISRKQTRQYSVYRKSTKEAMSGKRYAKEGEKQTIVPTKNQMVKQRSALIAKSSQEDRM